jgi:hypothetical protein
VNRGEGAGTLYERWGSRASGHRHYGTIGMKKYAVSAFLAIVPMDDRAAGRVSVPRWHAVI